MKERITADVTSVPETWCILPILPSKEFLLYENWDTDTAWEHEYRTFTGDDYEKCPKDYHLPEHKGDTNIPTI